MNYEIVESFAQMVREKSLDKDVLASIIEEIFGIMIKKKYGNEAKYEIVVNMDKGDIEIFLEREVVDVVEDPAVHISIEELNEKGNPDELEVGETYSEKLDLASFGRRMISLARQSLNQKIREIEKELIYKEYNSMIGEIVVGDIYQVRKNDVLVNHNKTELLLPRIEQLPKEKLRKGETTRAVVKQVKKTKNGPIVIISRADNLFLKRMFEIEIPEIYDGVIQIKGIAREPGERAKVAVESLDNRIDAVGACVGMKGVRIHAIVRELNNENIDVINYSDDPIEYIQRALSSAKLRQIEIDEENKKCKVYADSDQVSLIVGRQGVNIRLAIKLTGFDIEVIRVKKSYDEYDEDIELFDLQEELGKEIFEILRDNGKDYALEILQGGPEKLLEIEGIDIKKANFIINVLKNQFEEE